jgi:hypothetical protein
MAVWRDGTAGGPSEEALDMTLRLDNAGALPTYPQPQEVGAAALPINTSMSVVPLLGSTSACSIMGQLPASELDPHIAQDLGHSRDRRTHLTLEFAHLFALIFA